MASEECITNILDLYARTKLGTKIEDFNKMVEAWRIHMEPLDDKVVTEAAIIVGRNDTSNFIPSPGAVYQAALGLMDNEPDADMIWRAVLERARGRKDIELGNRGEQALAAIGGCGGWKEDDLPYRRREFIATYEKLEKRWRDDMAALPGGPQWKQLPG